MIAINTPSLPGSQSVLDLTWSPRTSFTFTISGVSLTGWRTPIDTTIVFEPLIVYPPGQDPTTNPNTSYFPVQVLWDFGDGITGTGPVAAHIFQTVVDELQVRITTIDMGGRRSSVARPIYLHS